MKDIILLETCEKCGGNLTLMESVRTDDGSLWLVKRCLHCHERHVEEVVQITPSNNQLLAPGSELARLVELLREEKKLINKWQTTENRMFPSEEFISAVYKIKDLDRQIDELLAGLEG